MEAEPRPLAEKLSAGGIRLGVLDNAKWNAGKLLRATVAALEEQGNLAEVRYYKKETFSKTAAPELIEQILRETDAVVTAVGD